MVHVAGVAGAALEIAVVGIVEDVQLELVGLVERFRFQFSGL